jgi:DNA-binding MarR family transcriptional regulator
MTKIPEDVLQLADAVHSAAIHLLRLLRTEDRHTGIGPAQLSALSVLVFGGGMSLKQLAAAEQVKPPTMVRIVQGLAEQKLAEIHPDREDHRKIRISATVRGRSLMHKARMRRVETLAQMLAKKTHAERQDLQNAVALLKKLTASGSTA